MNMESVNHPISGSTHTKGLSNLIKPSWMAMLIISMATSTSHADEHESPVVWQNITSEYTSVAEKNCTTLESVPEHEGYYHASCPSKKPYKIEVEGGDLRYGLQVVFAGKTLRYWVPEFFDIGNTVEWRSHRKNGQKIYHGLIYRMYRANYSDTGESLADKQELVVVRLDKQNTCILGTIPASKHMNVKARKLADNASAVCDPNLNDKSVSEAFLGS